MSAIINLSINLDKINKSKIISGKKGSYYNVTVSLNNDVDPYGNNASIFEAQTKEERDAKASRNYLGNGKVAWTDGSVSVAEGQQQQQPVMEEAGADLDLPF